MPVQANRYREVVKDFVSYKLRQNHIFIPGYNEDSSTKASRHLRLIADELIADNNELFESMCDQLHLTPTTTYPTFVGIADEIFQTGKNWGRIVAFLAFGATLAVYCAQREELFQLVNEIVEWVSRYMDQNLADWIEENGGWNGFMDFFQQEDSSKGESSNVSRWGIAAAAGLGIGALLMLATRLRSARGGLPAGSEYFETSTTANPNWNFLDPCCIEAVGQETVTLNELQRFMKAKKPLACFAKTRHQTLPESLLDDG